MPSFSNGARPSQIPPRYVFAANEGQVQLLSCTRSHREAIIWRSLSSFKTRGSTRFSSASSLPQSNTPRGTESMEASSVYVTAPCRQSIILIPINLTLGCLAQMVCMPARLIAMTSYPSTAYLLLVCSHSSLDRADLPRIRIPGACGVPSCNNAGESATTGGGTRVHRRPGA